MHSTTQKYCKKNGLKILIAGWLALEHDEELLD